MSRLVKQTFFSNGSWTCPAGVTTIIVWAMGGGSGASYFVGGVGTSLLPVILDVVPNTTYSIVIGAGGPGTTVSGTTAATQGEDTSFGALMTWKGAPPWGGNFAFINTGFFNNYNPYPTTAGVRTSIPQPGSSQAASLLAGYPGKIASIPSGSGSGMNGEALGGTGISGGNASANSGAGGGSTTGGANGNGGSGLLIITWAE